MENGTHFINISSLTHFITLLFFANFSVGLDPDNLEITKIAKKQTNEGLFVKVRNYICRRKNASIVII